MFKLFKEIKGVFVQPKKRFYFGRILHGAPYFYPINFNPTIFSFRKLVRRTDEELAEYNKKYPYNIDSVGYSKKYKNMPMVRRNKFWVKTIFGCDYYIEMGYPAYIHWYELGWKNKFDSPRFEWSPAFHIFFFGLQFCIFWNAPDGDNDQYYEQILWWKYWSRKDIELAETSWPWANCDTKRSTWNKKYVL